ncbi:MAG: TonB-dependent receptor plug domain-containing protein [Hyphomicrobiaceae bacterium]
MSSSKGQTTVGEVLNELPQLRSSFAQQNVGPGVGFAGLNLLDLRGLGTARTLVLVNGRRHVPADILNNAVSPDVNTIPTDLIERVNIVTGGNSAVYGSDAVARVVNFILRRNFQGVQARGQIGVSENGYGGNQYVSVMAGSNFGDDRGNIILHGEYSRQDRVFISDIPFLREVRGLVVTDTDPAGLTNGSDGVPDRTIVRDQRQTNINRNGLVFVSQPLASPACGLGANGVPFDCTFLFQPDGSLVPQTGIRYGTGVLGAFRAATARPVVKATCSRCCPTSSATTPTCSPITSLHLRWRPSSRPSTRASMSPVRMLAHPASKATPTATSTFANVRGWTIPSSTRRHGRRPQARSSLPDAIRAFRWRAAPRAAPRAARLPRSS